MSWFLRVILKFWQLLHIYLVDAIEKFMDYEGKLSVSAIKGIVPKHNDVVAHYLRGCFKKLVSRSQAVIATLSRRRSGDGKIVLSYHCSSRKKNILMRLENFLLWIISK